MCSTQSGYLFRSSDFYSRKPVILLLVGRSSDLLLLFYPTPSRFPSGLCRQVHVELTAAGTVPDLHRSSLFIPGVNPGTFERGKFRKNLLIRLPNVGEPLQIIKYLMLPIR